ncbi:hypothetical protein H8E07_22130 [bacterium]|nr:hypothetical protein [bacterium]
MNDWLDDVVREEGAVLFSDHPESRHLVLYAEAPQELDDGLRCVVADHLRVCDACADDLARLRAAVSELSAGETGTASLGLRERLAGWLAPRFLVPAVALAVAAFAVFGPGRDGPVMTPVGRSVVLRAEVERGDAPVAVPDEGGRLALTFSLPGDGDGRVERCAVTILDGEGRAAAEVAEIVAFDAYGTFVLVLDAAALPAGPYRLVARDRLGELSFSFTLQK